MAIALSEKLCPSCGREILCKGKICKDKRRKLCRPDLRKGFLCAKPDRQNFERQADVIR